MDAPDPNRRRLFVGAPDASPDVHVASFLVRAFPDRIADVRRAIEIAGCDVTAEHQSRLVVVVEAASERVIVDRLAEIEAIPGVLNAALVYHHAEPAAQLDEIVEPDAVAERES